MEMTVGTHTAPAANEKQRFVINMLTSGEDAPMVRSCELQGSGLRQRTSFTELRDIEEVFDRKVAAGLFDCLSRLREGERVLSLPEFLIEVEGLILAGVDLMVRQEKDGDRAIICRFRVLIGVVQRIFHPKLGMDDPIAGVGERMALEMLCDVGLPLLDVCAAAEGDLLTGSSEEKAFVRTITENAHELRFRLELIKRYLQGLDRPKVRPQEQLAQYEGRRIGMRPH